ncbi:MAG: pyridoxal-phosphate dependent enzyme, partial [Comamonas sp.]
RAVIVMPTTTPQVKVDAVAALGGEVVLAGDSYSDAYKHSLKLQKDEGLTFVHPFDDPEVIAGQGTIAMEMLRQLQKLGSQQLDAVFVAIGGGGLISGVANYIKAVRPEIKVIGVDTDQVCAAIKDIFVDTRSIVEPSGALAVAAIKQYVTKNKTKGETYAAILCGANMNFDRLRFVAERAEVGEEREALFAVTIPEERGSFKRFCEVVGKLPGGARNVTEFNYRISHDSKAHVFVGLTTHAKGESEKIAKNFEKNGFAALDLTFDEMAKEHLRHMVGGHSPLAQDERLLRFVFPERPGALFKFLSLMAPTWNISLFHYRNQGADYGRILVGMQVPAKDSKKFETFLKQLGYPWVEETHNPAYQLFLK